jgi:type I restriction enzyme R subunit
LSQIIEQINERLGTNFDPSDRLFFDAIAGKLVRRPDFQQQAAVNSPENFSLVLAKEFEGGVIDQMAAAEEVTIKYLDNPDLQTLVLQAYAPLIQGKAKMAHQEHCPIAELLGPDLESTHLEYKATLRTHADSGELYAPLETATLKTIAAFLNSRDGGTLLIGVTDDGTVNGLDSDYAGLHKPGQDDRERFQQHLANIVTASMGSAAATNVRPHLHRVNGGDVCRIQVDPVRIPG